MTTTNKEKLSTLTSLKARALKAYATKDFPQSADLYAQACELQTEIHGENNPANAHLLYLYGRSLYKVAIDKSDVLGGGAGATEKQETPQKSATTASGSKFPAGGKRTTGGLFQFTGDENYDDSDSDEDGDEESGEEEEEEEEMQAAWDVLDLARVFFEKQLDANANPPAENPPKPMSVQQVTDTKTMLADVYDLLGEVSLESENFPQATKDFDSALTLKTELYPIESTLISEAEFKMALALEFSSTDDGVSKEDAAKLREAAASHIEKSITSCRARIAVEEAKIAKAAAKAGDSKGKGKAKATESKESKEIEEVQGMIAELEQRLHDLKNQVEEPPVKDEITGLLGQILGGDQDPMLTQEALEKALKGANDVSALVRKKPKKPEAAGPAPAKRKLEEVVEEESKSAKVETSKKAKVEEV